MAKPPQIANGKSQIVRLPGARRGPGGFRNSRFAIRDLRLSFKLPVITQHLPMRRPEMLRELLGEIHRAMPSARAADADRHVAAAFGFEARQPRVEKAREVV